jgi:cob(I)alamin adenosyltransferase
VTLKAGRSRQSFESVVFEEITYVINYGFVPLDNVLSALHGRYPDLHVILIGRDAPAGLISIADMIAEMRQ